MDHSRESVTEGVGGMETSDSCTQMKWYVTCMFFKKDIFKAMATENYILGGFQMETLIPVKEKRSMQWGPSPKESMIFTHQFITNHN